MFNEEDVGSGPPLPYSGSPFDMVEWVRLFRDLMKRKISAVFLRILLFVYQEQSCNVGWSGRISFSFSVKNGVRQGAVSSPILFGIYIDKLIKLLRNSGLGCTIGSFYYGVRSMLMISSFCALADLVSRL